MTGLEKLKKNILFIIASGAVVLVLIFFVFKEKPKPPFGIEQKIKLTKEQQLAKDLELFKDDCQVTLDKAKDLVNKYKSDKNFWLEKGVCEFELAEYDRAKDSFQKVLSLDPENKGAKTYLEILSRKVINIKKEGISREEFESFLDIKLNPEIFDFIFAVSLPVGPNSNYSQYISADYTSDLEFDQVISHIKNELKKADISFNLEEFENRSAFLLDLSGPNNYVISVFKDIPITLVIDLSKK